MKMVFKRFCEGADGALLCFDLTDIGSLYALPEWIEFLDKGVPRFLIGTKYDIATVEERSVYLENYVQRFNCEFSFKCTSKHVEAVENIFKRIVITIKNLKEEQQAFAQRPKWMDFIPSYHESG